MPVDPKVQSLLDMMAASGQPPITEMTPEQARNRPRLDTSEPQAVAKVEDRAVPGLHGDIAVRIYTPEGNAPFPVLVYFHGGGFVTGDLESHDRVCRRLTNVAGCITVATDYRLAPEHKYPVAVDDCYAVTEWVAGHAGEFGGDPQRVAVGGDSAGGNLAAAVSLAARDRNGPKISFQLLIYPVMDATISFPSYTENAEGYFLTKAGMEWFFTHYLTAETDKKDPYLSPVWAEDLRNLPPALIITAEYDPLRDEGEAYAERLKEASVPVTLHRYEGMIHGFLSLAFIIERGQHAIDEAGAALKNALAASKV